VFYATGSHLAFSSFNRKDGLNWSPMSGSHAEAGNPPKRGCELSQPS